MLKSPRVNLLNVEEKTGKSTLQTAMCCPAHTEKEQVNFLTWFYLPSPAQINTYREEFI